jgi:hypothetical protein
MIRALTGGVLCLGISRGWESMIGNNLRVELLEDWDKAARDTGLGNMEDGIMCYASCCSNMGVEKRINGVR